MPFQFVYEVTWFCECLIPENGMERAKHVVASITWDNFMTRTSEILRKMENTGVVG